MVLAPSIQLSAGCVRVVLVVACRGYSLRAEGERTMYHVCMPPPPEATLQLGYFIHVLKEKTRLAECRSILLLGRRRRLCVAPLREGRGDGGRAGYIVAVVGVVY